MELWELVFAYHHAKFLLEGPMAWIFDKVFIRSFWWLSWLLGGFFVLLGLGLEGRERRLVCGSFKC